MYSINVLRRVSGDLSGDATITDLQGDGRPEVSVAVPVASPNTEISFSIRAAGLKMLMVRSDKPVTLYANAASGGSPDFNIPVAAGAGFLWTSADGTANPVTADVTKFYATATGSGTATVTISTLQDVTP